MYTRGMSKARTLKLGHGNPVTGERFWNRQSELDDCVRYLEEGAHVSLLAPRRTGKSSLMLEAAKRLSDRFVCLNVDWQAARSATMNHLKPLELPPWDGETTIGCLAALAAEYGLRLKLEAVEEILERLRIWIPHHVEMYFDHLLCYCRRRKLAEAAVAALVADHLPGDDRRGRDYAEIQAILEHDGYLRPSPERSYEFQSKLVRDWWNRRFGHTYVPVAERQGE